MPANRGEHSNTKEPKKCGWREGGEGLKGGFYGDITKILPPSQPPFPTLKRQIMTVL